MEAKPHTFNQPSEIINSQVVHPPKAENHATPHLVSQTSLVVEVQNEHPVHHKHVYSEVIPKRKSSSPSKTEQHSKNNPGLISEFSQDKSEYKNNGRGYQYPKKLMMNIQGHLFQLQLKQNHQNGHDLQKQIDDYKARLSECQHLLAQQQNKNREDENSYRGQRNEMLQQIGRLQEQGKVAAIKMEEMETKVKKVQVDLAQRVQESQQKDIVIKKLIQKSQQELLKVTLQLKKQVELMKSDHEGQNAETKQSLYNMLFQIYSNQCIQSDQASRKVTELKEENIPSICEHILKQLNHVDKADSDLQSLNNNGFFLDKSTHYSVLEQQVQTLEKKVTRWKQDFQQQRQKVYSLEEQNKQLKNALKGMGYQKKEYFKSEEEPIFNRSSKKHVPKNMIQ